MDPGWYRDPAPANPTAPTTLRYWDGQTWTSQLKPAPRQVRAAWRAEAIAQQREYALVGATQGGFAAAPGTLLETPLRGTTPDGQVLAGWWSRFFALVIDWVVTTILGTVFGWPFLMQIMNVFRGYLLATQQAAESNAPAPDIAILDPMLTPLLGLGLVMYAVKLVYHVGFLKAYQATPGKFLLGLEVRLREYPGPLSWGTVLRRWVAQNFVALASFVPLAPLFANVYLLLNYLWPLWDGDNQALHDKLARTNVVGRS